MNDLLSLPPMSARLWQLNTGVRNGKLIAVFSPAGRIGTTTIAAHLALNLAKRKSDVRVAAVDLVLDFGTLAQLFDVESKVAVDKLAGMRQWANSSVINQLIWAKQKNLAVLPAPAVLPKQFDLENLLVGLRSSFDYSVIDLPSSTTAPLVISVLQQSNIVVAVSEYAWSSIMTFRSLIDSERIAVSESERRDKTILVMNKVEWLPQDVLSECRSNLNFPITAELMVEEKLIQRRRLIPGSRFDNLVKKTLVEHICR